MSNDTLKRNYYEVLGLTTGANDDDIKKSYRKLAMKHHPDRHQGADAKTSEEKFKEVKEAFEALSNPLKRMLYDIYGHAGLNTMSSPTAADALDNNIRLAEIRTEQARADFDVALRAFTQSIKGGTKGIFKNVGEKLMARFKVAPVKPAANETVSQCQDLKS